MRHRRGFWPLAIRCCGSGCSHGVSLISSFEETQGPSAPQRSMFVCRAKMRGFGGVMVKTKFVHPIDPVFRGLAIDVMITRLARLRMRQADVPAGAKRGHEIGNELL